MESKNNFQRLSDTEGLEVYQRESRASILPRYGARKATFWLFFAFALALIVAAAIGGGIGAAIVLQVTAGSRTG